MEIPRRYIDNFTRGINTISEGAREALARELAALDYSDMTQAINDAVALMESYCSATSEAAARLAAQFYNGMSMIQTGEGYEAEAISGHVPVATEKAVRGIAQEGVDGNIAGMVGLLLARVDYEAKRAAGETVMGNAERDRRDVRFARVPSGHETCLWCYMLASRGFVYRSRESAGELNHYHANCDCRVVPGFAGATVEGYDPSEYYRIWKSGEVPQSGT